MHILWCVESGGVTWCVLLEECLTELGNGGYRLLEERKIENDFIDLLTLCRSITWLRAMLFGCAVLILQPFSAISICLIIFRKLHRKSGSQFLLRLIYKFVMFDLITYPDGVQHEGVGIVYKMAAVSNGYFLRLSPTMHCARLVREHRKHFRMMNYLVNDFDELNCRGNSAIGSKYITIHWRTLTPVSRDKYEA